MNNCKCKECHTTPIDNWNIRTDVPQYGSTYLQQQIRDLIPELSRDTRLLSAHVLVKFIGQPPNMHGGGVYEVTACFGFDHLVGRRYGFGYDKINEIKPISL